MRTIDTIVVHCSDSPQGRGDDVETVRRWHRERGWSDVGYHAVILEDGTVQQGRPDEKTGAHVRGHNGHTLGICLIGKRTFTEEQFDALFQYILDKREQYGDLDVMAHYELDRGKTCPNFDVQHWEELRGLDDAEAECDATPSD